eukprot:Ihof_evm2s276 gene=Ihof_evmTU2s276
MAKAKTKRSVTTRKSSSPGVLSLLRAKASKKDESEAKENKEPQREEESSEDEFLYQLRDKPITTATTHTVHTHKPSSPVKRGSSRKVLTAKPSTNSVKERKRDSITKDNKDIIGEEREKEKEKENKRQKGSHSNKSTSRTRIITTSESEEIFDAQQGETLVHETSNSDSDSPDEYKPTKGKKTLASNKITLKKAPVKKVVLKTNKKAKDSVEEEAIYGSIIYDKTYCRTLETNYPSSPGQTLQSNMVHLINAQYPLAALSNKLSHAGAVYSMCLSSQGNMLASVTTLGEICLWDLDTMQRLSKIRDAKEEQIDEFFVVRFSPDDKLLFAAGKRKDRKRWSDNDGDNAILPCPIKIFDVMSGDLVGQLLGHTEEVQDICMTSFKGRNILLSASQDGSFRRWDMADDWRSSTGHKRMHDDVTCMAFHVAPLPKCGNKYFLGACDRTLRLYDMETGDMVEEFGSLYSSYCDCVEVVSGPCLVPREGVCYVLTRGVEETVENIASRDNRVILHQLTAPSNKKGKWKLEEVRDFTDLEFHSNSYLCRLATNGIYVVAPTVTGSAFIWNLANGNKVAVLADHSLEREIRDIQFNHARPQILVCGD